jgi:DNA-binding SARP family transcriptional activator
VEFRVLGPVEVVHGDTPVRFARRQQRLVLGILALEANHVVTVDRLIDLLWNDQPPRNARAVLQSRVSEIRAYLGGVDDPDAEVHTVDNGYVLRTAPGQVDALVFRAAAGGWRELPSIEAARDSLRRALGLWRGPVLGGGLPDNVQVSSARGSNPPGSRRPRTCSTSNSGSATIVRSSPRSSKRPPRIRPASVSRPR